MGKLVTSLTLISGLILLFYFMGIIDDTINSTLLDLMLNPDGLEDSGLNTLILAALALGGIGLGVVIGIVSKNPRLIALYALAVYFLSLGYDIIHIYTKVSSSNQVMGVLVTLVMGVFLLIYVISVIDWWGGTDS